jgi:hypothetical protein
VGSVMGGPRWMPEGNENVGVRQAVFPFPAVLPSATLSLKHERPAMPRRNDNYALTLLVTMCVVFAVGGGVGFVVGRATGKGRAVEAVDDGYDLVTIGGKQMKHKRGSMPPNIGGELARQNAETHGAEVVEDGYRDDCRRKGYTPEQTEKYIQMRRQASPADEIEVEMERLKKNGR